MSIGIVVKTTSGDSLIIHLLIVLVLLVLLLLLLLLFSFLIKVPVTVLKLLRSSLGGLSDTIGSHFDWPRKRAQLTQLLYLALL